MRRIKMIILDKQGLPHWPFLLLALRHPTQRPEVSVDVFVKRQRFWTSIWSLKSLCQFVGNKWWHCQTPLLATNINIVNIGKPCKYLNIVHHKAVLRISPKPSFSQILQKMIFSLSRYVLTDEHPTCLPCYQVPPLKILLTVDQKGKQTKGNLNFWSQIFLTIALVAVVESTMWMAFLVTFSWK